jgi:hypothetical protein
MRPPIKCVPGALVTANGEQIGTSFSIIGYGAMPIGEKMDLEDKEHFKTIPAVPVAQQEDWQNRQKKESSDLAETLTPVPPREIPVVPGQIAYREFLEHCKRTGANPRPIGAFEPGGYLGPA